jgi:MSHA pilin protein MshA
MLKTSRAFTLIELVMVIAIVGILAAVALPRFIDAQRDARLAKAQALFGAMRSASALAHARCVLDLSGTSSSASCTSTGGTVDMEGVAVAMLNQYPARNALAAGSGIVAAAGIVPQADGVLVSTGTNPTTIDIVGAATVGGCRITYTEAAPNLAPAITLTSTDC